MSLSPFALGFTSLHQEISLAELAFTHPLPTWLNGTLVRNGPAQFEVGNNLLRHWFDGMAMLHRFTLQNGGGSYANQFVKSRAYQFVCLNKKLGFGEFATDPELSFWQRLKKIFRPQINDNPCINVAKIADKFVALTETPVPIEFDLMTLNTLGPLSFSQSLSLPGILTTAHPHEDSEAQEYINFETHFGRKNCYLFYRIHNGSTAKQLIGSIATDRPSYIHSFGLTKNYIILVEYPFIINPLRLLLSQKPFIENFTWRPERGTRITLLNRTSGKITNCYQIDSFFAFHHINAYEEDTNIVMDIIAYPDATIIDALYLDVLRGTRHKSFKGTGEFRRYLLALDSNTVTYTTPLSQPIEFPRIHCHKYMKPYRYIYAVGSDKNNPTNFIDRLIKLDLQNKSSINWHESDCYPGEPVFVIHPNAQNEDDGIILAVVLNTAKKNSFLLLLDANTLSEISRAELPHHIPFGFHGDFYAHSA